MKNQLTRISRAAVDPDVQASALYMATNLAISLLVIFGIGAAAAFVYKALSVASAEPWSAVVVMVSALLSLGLSAAAQRLLT